MMHTHTALHYALDILDELRSKGYTIVPLTPDRAMLDAGARVGELSDSTLERIYRAMLQAAAEDLP